MTDRQLRTYEISVWSLQDDFITVLKPYDLTDKRFVKDPIMKLNTDGTQNFSFSLPMYVYEGTERIENPLWYSVTDGLLLVNVRKIKVILNKLTKDEHVFEFLITKVTDVHESDTLYCEVECEGLAFHELGKIGYKISLSSENFYNEDYNSFVNGNEEPKANLQYWLDQFLTQASVASTSPATWYYDIQMDWGAYASATVRATNKVYEEPYTSSWTTSDIDLLPNETVTYKEKERLVDLEESNIYNLTQDLAETFGVFCRYEYLHDSNYYITGRRVIFYNSFMREQEGYLELTYPYSSSEVQREIDSTDLVTKMFVRPVDNDNSGSGWSTIMDVEANRSLEDYIMNFNYLHDIGSIDDDQYAFIAEYETKMREYNTAMIPIEQTLETLNERKVELAAALATAKNAVSLDQERINQAERLYNELDKLDGNLDGRVTIGPLAAKTAIIMHDSNSGNANMGYINISEKGVIYSTLKIYTTIDYTSTDVDDKLSGEIVGTPEYDEFNNLIKITNLYYNTDINASHMVFLTYDYRPKLYYENVKKIWVQRLAQDEADVGKYSNELGSEADSSSENTIYGKIAKNEEDYQSYLTQKKTLIAKFETWFGPAIREGYWQPDTYNDYGDSYIDSLQLVSSSVDNFSVGNSIYTKIFWDSELFDDEDDIKYTITAAETVQYYPIVKLTPTAINKIYDHLDDVCFVYWDINIDNDQVNHAKDARAFALGSQCNIAFTYDYDNTSKTGQIVPCLVLTGATSFTEDQLNFMKKQWCLGKLKSDLSKDGKSIDVELTSYYRVTSGDEANNVLWLVDSDKTKKPLSVYYPRIEINSLFLKTSSDQLALKLNGTILENYEDYYILTRDGKYYITIKPQSLIGNNNKNIETFNTQLKFALSNANISIYLDALQVLQENAYPKVSYSITPNVVNDQFVYTDYDALARIVRINDIDLKLDNVYGYISEVNLDLAQPWEDNVVIQNYKNKFEDLFSKIVAQTEQMKKSEYTVGLAASLFADGQLSGEVVQNSLRRVDLNYAFNNGKLIIDEINGIWGISDSGVVAYRGGGIFTATTKDSAGNWMWNTGIVPQGINADLIVAGQLDTNKIKIYAGDTVRFQLNGDGLFAYKSFMEDFNILSINNEYGWSEEARTVLNDVKDDLQPGQYVTMNQNGLFLVAKEGAQVPYLEYVTDNSGKITGGAYKYQTVKQDTNRVEISWDGLKLRNWENKETFWANADTGDLYITGSLVADKLTVTDNYSSALQDRISSLSLADWVNNKFDDHVNVSKTLGDLIENTKKNVIDYVDAATSDLKAELSDEDAILTQYIEKISTPVTFNARVKDIEPYWEGRYRVDNPSESGWDFKVGDVWRIPTDNGTEEAYYVATAGWQEVYGNETKAKSNDALNSLAGWTLTHDYSLAAITGASLSVNANTGVIDILSQNQVNIESGHGVYIAAGENVDIVGNKAVNIGGTKINIVSASANDETVIGGITLIATQYDVFPGQLEETKKDVTWEQGGIANENGKNSSNGRRIRTNKIEFDKYNTIFAQAQEGYQIYTFKYSNDDIYLGAISFRDSVTISKTDEIAYVRFSVKRITNEAIFIDESNNITIKRQFQPGQSNVEILPTGITLASTDGINIKSGAGISIKSSDDENISVIEIDKDRGIRLGSTESITFYSGDVNTEDSAALVKISKESILFGVADAENNTIVEMTKDYAIFGASGQEQVEALRNATEDNNWIVNNEVALSGVKITKQGIWLGTVEGDNSGLVAITPASLTLGIASEDNSGSFIQMTKNNFTIGASGNMYINTKNIGLDTLKRQEATIGETTYDKVGFRLGEADDPVLVFENENLHVKGAITATSLEISNNDTSSTIDEYIDDRIQSATNFGIIAESIDEAKKLLQSQIDSEIDTWFYQATPAPTELPGSGSSKERIEPVAMEQEWGIAETDWDKNTGYNDTALAIIERHNSDVFYDISKPAEGNTAGYAYRFIVQKDKETKTITYHWDQISDTTMTAALKAASKAQTTADNKIKTFYREEAGSGDNLYPKESESADWDEGDIWFNISKNNEAYRCYLDDTTETKKWKSVRDTEYVDAINNIEIGGRNLLLNSATNFPIAYNNSTKICRITKRNTNISVPEWGCSDALQIIGTTNANATCLLMGFSSHGLAVDVTSIYRQQYTASMYIKNNGDRPIRIHANLLTSINSNTTTPWIIIEAGKATRWVQTCVGDGSRDIQINIAPSGNDGSDFNFDFTFWHPQIEYGNKVSDWSTAPEDSNVGRNLLWGTTSPQFGNVDNPLTVNGYRYKTTNGGLVYKSAGQSMIAAEHGIRIYNTSTSTAFALGIGRLTPTQQATLPIKNGEIDPLMGLIPGKSYVLSGNLKFCVLSQKSSSTSPYIQVSMLIGTDLTTPSYTDTTIQKINLQDHQLGTTVYSRLFTYFTIPDDAKIFALRIRPIPATNASFGANDYFEITNMKLEEGTRATPWSPAPEDSIVETTQPSIDSLGSQINTVQEEARGYGYYYGTCNTVAGTQTKQVALVTGTNVTKFNKGAIVAVKFTNDNTHSTPNLTVGTTTAAITGNGVSSAENYWKAGDIVNFVYDGDNWQIVGSEGIALAIAAQSTANNKNHIYYQDTVPDKNLQTGDLWYNTGESTQKYAQYAKYMWTGGAWRIIDTMIVGTKLSVNADSGIIAMSAPNAIQIASGKSLTITGNARVAIGSNTEVSIAASNGNAIVMNSNGIAIDSGGRLVVNTPNFLISTLDNNKSDEIQEFRLGSKNDPLLQLITEDNGASYMLNINESAITLPSNLSSLGNKIIFTSKWNGTSPSFPAFAPIGSLGIAYYDTLEQGTDSSSVVRANIDTSTESNYLPTAIYNTGGHEKKTYFGHYAVRWNVSRGANDTFTSDQWSRVGVYEHVDSTNGVTSYSNVSATYVPVRFLKEAKINDEVSLSFNWQYSPAASGTVKWNCYPNVSDLINKSANKTLSVRLYSSAPTSNTTNTISALTDEATISLNKSSPQLNYTYSFSGSIGKLKTGVEQNDVAYLVFYCSENIPTDNSTGTLRYIDQTSVSIGSGTVDASARGQVAIYIRTAINNSGGSQWRQLAIKDYGV